MSEEQVPAEGEAGGEPSMEDILASIRRILSEEEEQGESAEEATASEAEPEPEPEAAPAPEPEAAPAPEPEAAPAPEPEAAPAPEPEAAPEPEPEAAPEPEPEIEIEMTAPEPPPPPPPPPLSPPVEEPVDVLELTSAMIAPEEAVIGAPAQQVSTDILSDLARAILDQRDVPIGGASNMTLEGMVREMLRPVLREWLDRNLPYLIERLVKKEIDHMINRAERLED